MLDERAIDKIFSIEVEVELRVDINVSYNYKIRTIYGLFHN